MIQLQRWWGKFGLCCGTRAKGLLEVLDGVLERVNLELKFLDGMLERVDLELKFLDGRLEVVLLDECHFSSLQVGEASLEKMVTPEQIWSFMLMQGGHHWTFLKYGPHICNCPKDKLFV